jgi:hypothetical protein
VDGSGEAGEESDGRDGSVHVDCRGLFAVERD